MSINSGLAAPAKEAARESAKESAKESARVVLDVGKTLSKLTLWSADGRLIAHRNHPNRGIRAGSYVGLDTGGIEAFLVESLRDFAQMAEIEALIPIGHGAAAAIVDDDGLVLPPLDYEHPIPPAIRSEYDTQRDPFAETGSPLLPDGLNLGAQFHFLETLEPG